MAEEGEQKPVAPPVAGGPIDLHTAVQEVLKTALTVMGLTPGLREVVKLLNQRKVLVCLLANNCDEPTYVKTIEALCSSGSIPLIRVDDNKKLGEWVGQCKIDREGNARKVVRCSVAAITDWGPETAAHDVLRSHIEAKTRS